MRQRKYDEVRGTQNEPIGSFADRVVALVIAREVLLTCPRPRATALLQCFDWRGTLLAEDVIALKTTGGGERVLDFAGKGADR